MTRILTETNVADLLKVSNGENDALRRLTEELQKKVEEQFKHLKVAEELKRKAELRERASTAAAG